MFKYFIVFIVGGWLALQYPPVAMAINQVVGQTLVSIAPLLNMLPGLMPASP